MGRIRNRIIPFKVINGDINKEDFEGYDVMQYLVNCYKKIRRRKHCPKTYDEFKEWVDRKLVYMFWARCQYEIVLIDSSKVQKQIELNNEYEDLINAQQHLVKNNPEFIGDEAYYNLVKKTQKIIHQYYNNQQKIDVYYQLTQNFDIVMLVFLYNIGKLDLIETPNVDSFKIMANGENEVIEWINVLDEILFLYRYSECEKIPKNLSEEILKTFYGQLTGLVMLDWPCKKIHKELTKSFQIEMNLEILTKIIEYKLKTIIENGNINKI